MRDSSQSSRLKWQWCHCKSVAGVGAMVVPSTVCHQQTLCCGHWPRCSRTSWANGCLPYPMFLICTRKLELVLFKHLHGFDFALPSLELRQLIDVFEKSGQALQRTYNRVFPFSGTPSFLETWWQSHLDLPQMRMDSDVTGQYSTPKGPVGRGCF